MPNPDAALHGMMLEEVLLALLRNSGYTPIDDPAQDPISLEGSNGFVKVRGRGGAHQIDVIADFKINIPFTYPLRLLLESKCYDPGSKAGIGIVRNAVGVLKDVSEFWHINQNRDPVRRRHHYQYVLCSSSGYSDEAQRFAFVQDINLLQIPPGTLLSQIVDMIRSMQRSHVRGAGTQTRRNSRWLIGLRQKVRRWLQHGRASEQDLAETFTDASIFIRILEWANNLNECYLTFLAGRLPVLLVPEDGTSFQDLIATREVRFFYDTEDTKSWFIESQDETRLFRFSMPPIMLQEYLTSNQLTPTRALDAKQDLLGSMQILQVRDGRVQWIHFQLDEAWISQLREGLDAAISDEDLGRDEGLR